MTMVRYGPFGVFRDFDRYLQARTFTRPLAGFNKEGTWTPRLDVYHRDGSLVVRAEVPGVDPEDIDITAEGDMLKISGSRSFGTTTGELGFRCKEIFEGTFSRSIRIPMETDREAIEAVSSHGILEITLPIPAEVVPRKIAVHAGA